MKDYMSIISHVGLIAAKKKFMIAQIVKNK